MSENCDFAYSCPVYSSKSGETGPFWWAPSYGTFSAKLIDFFRMDREKVLGRSAKWAVKFWLQKALLCHIRMYNRTKPERKKNEPVISGELRSGAEYTEK